MNKQEIAERIESRYIWHIQKHTKLSRKTIKSAKEMKETVQDRTWITLQDYLDKFP